MPTLQRRKQVQAEQATRPQSGYVGVDPWSGLKSTFFLPSWQARGTEAFGRGRPAVLGTKDHQPLPDPQAGSSSRKTELPWAEYDKRKKRGGRRVGPCLEPAGLAHSRFGRPRGGLRGGEVLFSILLVLHVKLPHAGLGFYGKRPVALYPCVLPGALQRRGRGQRTAREGKSELSPLPFHLPEHRG